jgi:hypothetical protein
MKLQSVVARILMGLVFASILSACGTSRPSGLQCGLTKYIEEPGPFPFAGIRDRDLNVLSLSAGGEYGAYGAGFLVGWSEASSPRPIHPKNITVVTGVSTGALVATHAFLGRFDEVRKIYESLSGDQIYKEYGFLKLLFSNSLTDSSGKDVLIRGFVTKELVDAVAVEALEHPLRKLLVGAVDIESGEFLKISLSKLAADKANPNREACFEAAVGAASAIPIVFSPVFIDGRMLVDGAARHNAFLQNIDAIHLGGGVNRRIFSIYHGDFDAGASTVANNLISIAKRSAAVVSDQLVKDTAYRMDYISRYGPENRRFETYYSDARNASKTCAPLRKSPECKVGGSANEEDMFCTPFMICLSAEGRKDGKRVASDNSWTRELMTDYLGSGR